RPLEQGDPVRVIPGELRDVCCRAGRQRIRHGGAAVPGDERVPRRVVLVAKLHAEAVVPHAEVDESPLGERDDTVSTRLIENPSPELDELAEPPETAVPIESVEDIG